ncbi:SPW repeat protein [Phytohabitans flavus]|nr:SPW repeat protein [Phytohabitans flavus]
MSRYDTGMQDHPDVAEMRDRYERMTDSSPASIVDGLVLLAGAWLAISPWVVHFDTTTPDLRISNLILGLIVAAIGLGLTIVPRRIFRLSWAVFVIGAWVVVSPWVIQQSSVPVGNWLNNVITGGVTALLGIAAAVMMAASRLQSRPQTSGRRYEGAPRSQAGPRYESAQRTSEAGQPTAAGQRSEAGQRAEAGQRR